MSNPSKIMIDDDAGSLSFSGIRMVIEFAVIPIKYKKVRKSRE